MGMKDLNEQKWFRLLSKEQYKVLREKGTELPFSGMYVKFNSKGEYACAACSNKLFLSDAKFDSGCGWPSFYDAIKGSVKFKEDSSHGMHRVEVTCSKCGSHLGHIFDDGPMPTCKRYCINSAALNFIAQEKK